MSNFFVTKFSLIITLSVRGLLCSGQRVVCHNLECLARNHECFLICQYIAVTTAYQVPS